MTADADILIGGWIDGGLDAAGEQQLADLAKADPAVGDRVLRALALDAQLGALLREEAGPAAMARAVQARLAAQGESKRIARSVVKRLRRRERRPAFAAGWGVAAALAAGLLVTWLLLPATQPVTAQPVVAAHPVEPPAPQPTPASTSVAEVRVPGRAHPQQLANHERFLATQACTVDVRGAATLELEAGSEIAIGTEATGIRVDLATGTLRASVRPVPPGTTFAVRTDQGTATVIGTRFTVVATSDGTTVAVHDGSVRVAGLSGEILAAAGQQVFVPLGRGALVPGPIR